MFKWNNYGRFLRNLPKNVDKHFNRRKEYGFWNREWHCCRNPMYIWSEMYLQMVKLYGFLHMSLGCIYKIVMEEGKSSSKNQNIQYTTTYFYILYYASKTQTCVVSCSLSLISNVICFWSCFYLVRNWAMICKRYTRKNICKPWFM